MKGHPSNSQAKFTKYLVQFSCSAVSDSLRPMDCSTPGFPVHHLELAPGACSWSLLKLMSIELVMPSNHLIFCGPLLLPPSIFPSIRVFFQWVSSLHHVAKVLEFQLQHQSFQWIFRTDFLDNWLVWSPWSPRDSQESSPTPQFKSISSYALSFLSPSGQICGFSSSSYVWMWSWTIKKCLVTEVIIYNRRPESWNSYCGDSVLYPYQSFDDLVKISSTNYIWNINL